MSKKVLMVMPKNGIKVDLDKMDIDTMGRAYNVPRGIFDLVGTVVPDFIKEGLKKFVMDVPTVSKDENEIRFKITLQTDPPTIIKISLSLKPGSPHKIKISTDDGNSWKELTYTSTYDSNGTVYEATAQPV